MNKMRLQILFALILYVMSFGIVLADIIPVKPTSPAWSNQSSLPQGKLIQTQHTSKQTKGIIAVKKANQQAVTLPSSVDTLNSIIIFQYEPGDLYQIYAAPLNVTDIELQAGEKITSVAAGDTVRWQVSKTVSGSDTNRIEHLLIKPLAENLNTTMVVTTNLRTYHLLLKSTNHTFMAAVQWRYSNQTMLMNNLADSAQSSTTLNIPVDLSKLDFSYHLVLLKGKKPDWVPLSIFNDKNKTYIELPKNIQSAPTLFIKQNGSGDAAVNYRVMGNYYVIDQVITSAELTSGDGGTVIEIDYGSRN